MSFSILEHSIENFQCFKDKNSVYFGEVSYIGDKGDIVENKEKGKPIRNGIGVQIFLDDDGKTKEKFEGNWVKDKPIRNGAFKYPDGSYYNGEIKGNLPNGYGNFEWFNGMRYNGNWLNGRMEGGGKFFHVDEDDIFIHPFILETEIEDNIKRRRHIDVIREENLSKKLFSFKKVISKYCSKEAIFSKIAKDNNSEYFEFDLRFAECERRLDRLKPYMESIKRSLAKSFIEGHVFIINFDDSSRCQYKDIFDPDLRDFYSPNCFPSKIWDFKRFCRSDDVLKVLAGTEFAYKNRLNKKFKIFIWTKYKINEGLSDDRIIEKFFKRIRPIIRTDGLDYYLVKEEEIVPIDVVEEKPIEEIDVKEKAKKK